MLKFIYTILSVISFVMLLVAYFQNIGKGMNIDFFTSKLQFPIFMFYVILISVLFGVFLVLTIKSFTSSGNNNLDDEFNL